jgi:hypothetical protein
MVELGIILFAIALLVTFLRLRAAAAMILAASLLCLPFYLYFVAPGPFRAVFRGEYTVPAPANFVWDRAMLAGIVTVLIAALLSLRILRFPTQLQP